MTLRALPLTLLATLAGALTLAGCGLFASDGPVRVVAIGTLDRTPSTNARALSAPDALLLDATARGMVAHDGEGQIEAGLADRWTVIDDGRSYIFRLRETHWADGQRVTAEDVAGLLQRRVKSATLPLSLRGELRGIESIRAMTGKVIELRLSRPLPHLLDLLAHPAMALQRRGAGWGPLAGAWTGGTVRLSLIPNPADAADDETTTEPVALLWGARTAAALTQFRAGEAAAVLGGRIEDWPYLAAARIADNRVIRDPVEGLFGLAVVNDAGFLSENLSRDAVAMAIDRSAMVDALAIPDWQARTTLRPAGTAQAREAAGDVAPIYPAWIDFSLVERRRRAREIVAAWTAERGDDGPLRMRIALPTGPGARMLFAQLHRDLAAVGIDSIAVPLAADADLRLIDEVAPIGDTGWYLRRLGCGRGLLCDQQNDTLLTALRDAATPADAAAALAAADEAMTRFGAFIPLATPVRWGVIAPRLTGYRPNARGRHSITRLLPPPE